MRITITAFTAAFLTASCTSESDAPSSDVATATAADATPDEDAAAPDASGRVTADAEPVSTDTPEADSADEDASVGPSGPADWASADCDPIMPERCALPWPSNRFLAADAATKTGYRLRFGANTGPRNVSDEPISPEPYAHLDGYGVSSSLLMLWPNLDLTGLATELDPAPSMTPDAPIVILEMAGAQGDPSRQVVRRIPYFVERDVHEPDPAKALLIVRPLVILNEATRYVVAVRGLTPTDGAAYAASPAFAALLGGTTKGTGLESRQAQFDEVFTILEGEGIAKGSLQLAWDFVTASSETEHGRLLSLRDQAQAIVGALGPELTITKVTEHTEAEDPNIAIELEGTFHVPSFIRIEAGIGLHYLNLGDDGMPEQNGWRDPVFYVKIPHSALDGTPHGLLEYGHGLNGHADEVGSGYLGKIARDHHLVLYACHMYGMSEFEINQTLLAVTNLDRFPALPQKLHQGLVEHVLLQRGMRERFAALGDVKAKGITVDPARMYYYGNSQGAIYGGTVMAISTDVTRGALGVSGNNYSILLQRSVDFDTFFSLLRGYYPDPGDQLVLLNMVQLLWDSVDSVTHYAHLTASPHPGTPAHAVLADIAVGDHQVAPLTQEIAARTGRDLRLMAGWGRPVFGVDPQPYPYVGSGVVSWNCGNDFAAPGNVPPTEGKDPHECPRRRPEHMSQMAHFFETGEIIDVCGGKPCVFPPN